MEMKGTEEQRKMLYNQGLNDNEIAQSLGIDRSSVRSWRKARKLKPNVEWAGANHPEHMRRLLCEMGWGAGAISRFQGVTRWTVEEWRQRNGFNSGGTRRRITRRGGDDQLKALHHRVIRAVGTKLPFDIAAEAAAALMLAVIEGEVPLDQIEQNGRKFGGHALQAFANGFRQSSLDEDIPGTDGIRPVDLLVDESSQSWLEEMGATWH